MFENLKYAYLIGSLFFFAVWLIFFILRKDLRKKMLIMSVFFAPLGPIAQFFHLRDYWHPQVFLGWGVGLEDALFAFSAGGIAGVVYEEFFGKKFTKRHLKGRPTWLLGSFVFWILSMYLGSIVFKINSLYVCTASFFILGAVMLAFRRDLIKDALFSGLFAGFLMFVFYYLVYIPLFPEIIQKWWMIDNLSGIFVLGVPIEEIIWGVSGGFMGDPSMNLSPA